MSVWMRLLEICVPVLVALVPIIPTITGSGKKTRDAIEELKKDTKKQIDSVEKKLEDHVKEEEWNNAKQRRIRILRFNDEICSGVVHSENHYEEIIEDIDEYETFCEAHKDYKNNKGKIAMAHIKAEYQMHKDKRDFLN